MAGIHVDMGKTPQLMKRIPETKKSYIRGQMEAGFHFVSKINVYPPERHGPAMFQSHDEMKAFFAQLREGKIDVPYVRGISPSSERLGQKWQVRKSANRVSIQNKASYASKVQGKMQHPYHKKTGWKTVETVLRAEIVTMVRIISRRVYADLTAR